MSNETQEVEKEEAPIVDPTLKDLVLVTLVNTCNKSDLEIGITLLVGGIVITGNLVSGKKYIDGVASLFEEANAKALAEWYREFGEEAYGSEGSHQSQIPEMIHLKDAKIMDGTATHNVGWWRGKINSVDGHNIGYMTRDN